MLTALPLLIEESENLDTVIPFALADVPASTLDVLKEAGVYEAFAGYMAEAFLANQHPSIPTALAAIGAWPRLAFIAQKHDIIRPNDSDITKFAYYAHQSLHPVAAMELHANVA